MLAAYFLYVSALVLWRGRTPVHPGAFAFLIPAGLWLIASIDRGSPHRGWSILRDWMPAALLLLAYWSVDWAPAAHPDRQLEQAFAGWDRLLLDNWGLRAGIERFGVLVPSVLEAAYLLVYPLPPAIIAVFYIRHERDRLDDFLFPFFVGTLTTYALLPHFPSDSPRLVFPGRDLPGIDTWIRHVNLWILDHGDIQSSVFPSGHVAVGFSAAFAMWLAVPGQPRIGWALMTGATMVWITTIYERYHYAADGLASLAVCGTSIGLIAACRALAARRRHR